MQSSSFKNTSDLNDVVLCPGGDTLPFSPKNFTACCLERTTSNLHFLQKLLHIQQILGSKGSRRVDIGWKGAERNAFVKSKYNLTESKQVGQCALCAGKTEVWGQVFLEVVLAA